LLGIYPVLAAPADDAPHPIEVVGDGTIWAGTVTGTRVYRPDGSIKQDISTANSPLGSDEVRAIRSDPANGVVWIATAAGLHRYDLRYTPAPPPDIPLEARVYPNPSRITSIGFRLSVAGNVGTYEGAVYDLTGR